MQTSNKAVWSNVFWYVTVYIFWKFIQYPMHWDKTQIFLKIIFAKDKRNKNWVLSFFHELQLITVLLLILDSYMSWSTSLVSLKVYVNFPLSILPRFYWKLYFCWRKYMASLTLNRHFLLQIKIMEKLRRVLLSELWFLSCNTKFWNLMMAAWVKAP